MTLLLFSNRLSKGKEISGLELKGPGSLNKGILWRNGDGRESGLTGSSRFRSVMVCETLHVSLLGWILLIN
jgi:hypothetical protein